MKQVIRIGDRVKVIVLLHTDAGWIEETSDARLS